MTRTRRLPVLVLIFLCSVILSAQIKGTDPSTVNARAEKILRAMTLEEKIDYIGGVDDFYIRPIPRLGIPAIKMADGPAGVRNYGHATAFPTGIAMAASFDTDLVHRIGVMMGRDARARGVHIMLAPGVNIYRAPMCGRNFEYFGEDPFLASRMAVSEIEGVQSQGVMSTVKHFVANNQEWDRHNVSSDVDERTLREIYLPAFEASVKEAHVGAIMDSYNLVNGVHMTQNGWLNTDVVRKDWGFTGIMMSDWDATYDGVAAANNGLDLEMPSGKFMNRATLLAAVKDGRVTEATIDEKVRRILRTTIAFGFFDRDQTDKSIPLDNLAAHAVALDAARGSIVLLKNDGILPLQGGKYRRIAVIGPNADHAAYGGGGSGLVQPFHAVSPLEGIRKLVGSQSDITFSPGVSQLDAVYQGTSFTTEASGGTAGLKGEYFNNKNLEGTPALTRTDQHIRFDWGEDGYAAGQPKYNYSARWTGYYTPRESRAYTFSIAGDDGYRLWVDDQLVIDQWVEQGTTLKQKQLTLVGGHPYKIRLEYFQAGGGANISFGIADDRNHEIEAATKIASDADIVILCIGYDADTEGEGFDRPFELPAEQVKLIDAVLKANKNVVVVLNAGGNVDMSPFLTGARALLDAWYPGQEGGTAVAEILFGKVNPSGKLPISLERRWEDNATFNSYYDPDKTKHVAYKEGVFLGYRHFDKSGIAPLFPFGFGLSYTKFSYSGLKITPAKARGTSGYKVAYTVKNVGERAGGEVAQVYVGEQNPRVPRPVKELKGFTKTFLKPGESKRVEVLLDSRAFAYYDVNTKSWKTDPGRYDILVGSSSQKIELKGLVTLK
jgi:beta-glucosidase